MPVVPQARPCRDVSSVTICSVRAIVTASLRVEALGAGDGGQAFARGPAFTVSEKLGQELVLLRAIGDCAPSPCEEPLAYILYTSGSTGRPKDRKSTRLNSSH